jgi:hypothetical protein
MCAGETVIVVAFCPSVNMYSINDNLQERNGNVIKILDIYSPNSEFTFTPSNTLNPTRTNKNDIYACHNKTVLR